MLQLPLIAQINQSGQLPREGLTTPLCGLKYSKGCSKKIAYHPGFAAEVVDGEERVDARNAAEMQANHKVPEVLTGDHTVGVLANQDKVWFEGPAAGRTESHQIVECGV